MGSIKPCLKEKSTPTFMDIALLGLLYCLVGFFFPSLLSFQIVSRVYSCAIKRRNSLSLNITACSVGATRDSVFVESRFSRLLFCLGWISSRITPLNWSWNRQGILWEIGCTKKVNCKNLECLTHALQVCTFCFKVPCISAVMSLLLN